MTFDDGILYIYTLTDASTAGRMPQPQSLTSPETYYFAFETVGINRYYTALQAQQQIDAVVTIPDNIPVNSAMQIVVMENDDQFRIRMVQHLNDDDGLQVTRLSLERIGDAYAVLS